MSVGDLGDRGDVQDLEAGIADRLAEHEAGLGPDRRGEGGRVARIDEARLDAEARQRELQQVGAAAIERLGGDDMPAGAHQGRDREVERGLAARGRDRADPALERGDALLQHRRGRVRDARVDVAGALEVEQRRRPARHRRTRRTWSGRSAPRGRRSPGPAAARHAAPACRVSEASRPPANLRDNRSLARPRLVGQSTLARQAPARPAAGARHGRPSRRRLVRTAPAPEAPGMPFRLVTLLLCVVLATPCPAAEVTDYDYPFVDPLEATVIGTPAELSRRPAGGDPARDQAGAAVPRPRRARHLLVREDAPLRALARSPARRRSRSSSPAPARTTTRARA